MSNQNSERKRLDGRNGRIGKYIIATYQQIVFNPEMLIVEVVETNVLMGKG